MTNGEGLLIAGANHSLQFSAKKKKKKVLKVDVMPSRSTLKMVELDIQCACAVL